MRGIARVGVDTAGGTITGALQDFVTIDGALVALQGASVSPHGDAPHSGAQMAQGSSFITINGIPVCLADHTASCGHGVSGSDFAKGSE